MNVVFFIQFQLTNIDFVPLWTKFFARDGAEGHCPPSPCSLVQVVHSRAAECP